MEQDALLVAVMRSLGATWRSLRLYPASSPLTVETAERVCRAVDDYVQAEPSLKLDVVREGFILRGIEGVLTAPGVPDLADALGAHGIGEVHFLAPPSPDEVLELLSAAQLRPQDLHEQGGMQKVLAKQGVTAIRAVSVVLSKVEVPPEIPEEEADRFLAELAADAGRLAVWLGSLLASDDEGLAEGMLTLADAAGDVRVFGRTLSQSFLELEAGDKDRLLEASIDLEPIRHVCVEMLANLSATEIVAAIRGGRYGENVSAMSFVLSSIPVGDRTPELTKEAEDALRAADSPDAQIELLCHLIDVRSLAEVEPALAEVEPLYSEMLNQTLLHPDMFDGALGELSERSCLDADGVATLLYLLDTADDPLAYSRVLSALGRAVPHLLGVGDPDLAMQLMKEIGQRSVSSDKPWPGLDTLFSDAMEHACGVEAMDGLIGLLCADESMLAYANEFVSLGGETASRNLAAAAIRSDIEASLECAERILGRRLPELVAPEVPSADARHAAKLAEMCARDAGTACMQALSLLASRPEDRVRSETARGVVAAGGPAVVPILRQLLRDESASVSLVAARSLIRTEQPEAVELIAGRVSEFEGTRDLDIAEEMIRLLASSGTPSAQSALQELAEKGSLLKRGRNSALKRMAKEALDSMTGRGGA